MIKSCILLFIGFFLLFCLIGIILKTIIEFKALDFKLIGLLYLQILFFPLICLLLVRSKAFTHLQSEIEKKHHIKVSRLEVFKFCLYERDSYLNYYIKQYKIHPQYQSKINKSNENLYNFFRNTTNDKDYLYQT